MYESRSDAPLPRPLFLARMVRHAAAAFALVLVSLGSGMAGYEGLENLRWRDAFVNSAMLLGGMGPVDAPKSDAGKVFAGLYALYSGLVVIATAAARRAPLVTRRDTQPH